jgi:hypothetical protein
MNLWNRRPPRLAAPVPSRATWACQCCGEPLSADTPRSPGWTDRQGLTTCPDLWPPAPHQPLRVAVATIAGEDVTNAARAYWTAFVNDQLADVERLGDQILGLG